MNVKKGNAYLLQRQHSIYKKRMFLEIAKSFSCLVFFVLISNRSIAQHFGWKQGCLMNSDELFHPFAFSRMFPKEVGKCRITLPLPAVVVTEFSDSFSPFVGWFCWHGTLPRFPLFLCFRILFCWTFYRKSTNVLAGESFRGREQFSFFLFHFLNPPRVRLTFSSAGSYSVSTIFTSTCLANAGLYTFWLKAIQWAFVLDACPLSSQLPECKTVLILLQCWRCLFLLLLLLLFKLSAVYFLEYLAILRR